MPNSNCLEGMACPKCKSEGPFYIEVTTLACMYDDGTDPSCGASVDFNDASYCECGETGCHQGAVKDFKSQEGT